MIGPRKGPPRSALLTFFLLAALPFFGAFPYIGAVNNPNENVRLYMTMAIVETGSLRIDPMVERYGWVNDMARVPSREAPGTFYYTSVKAPAVSLVGVPVYWGFEKIAPRVGLAKPTVRSPPEEKARWLRFVTWALRLTTIQLPSFLFLIWFERHLRRVSPDAVLRLATVTAVGLGTNYLAYALMFVSHTLVGVTAFLAFGLADAELVRLPGNARARSPGAAFLAGMAIGWATALEYQSLPLSVAIGLFGLVVFRSPRRLLAYAAGGLVPIAMVMLFQWRAYYNPFTPGHKFVESAVFAAGHDKGIFGVQAPDMNALKGLLWSPEYGLFGLSPFLTLAFLAFPFALVKVVGTPSVRPRRRAATVVWIVAVSGLTLSISGYYMWRGGWTIGPRLLGGLPPFLGYGALCALEWLAQRGRFLRGITRGVASGLALASVLSVGLVGVTYNTLPPEEIQRPLKQFVVPLVRMGFVPHHVLEWFGVKGYWPFWVIVCATVAIPLYVGVLVLREPWKIYGPRLVVLAAAALGGLRPALDETGLPTALADNQVRAFTSVWEPPGRDRVTLMREEAERYGSRRPCAWRRLGQMERVVHLDLEADAHEARAVGVACRGDLRF